MAGKKGKSGSGGTGTKTVGPKKDTMAKNIGDHMGGGTMGKKVPLKKTGGRAK